MSDFLDELVQAKAYGFAMRCENFLQRQREQIGVAQFDALIPTMELRVSEKGPLVLQIENREGIPWQN